MGSYTFHVFTAQYSSWPPFAEASDLLVSLHVHHWTLLDPVQDRKRGRWMDMNRFALDDPELKLLRTASAKQWYAVGPPCATKTVPTHWGMDVRRSCDILPQEDISIRSLKSCELWSGPAHPLFWPLSVDTCHRVSHEPYRFEDALTQSFDHNSSLTTVSR